MSVKSFEIIFESNYPKANVLATITGDVSNDILVKMFSDVLCNSLYYALDSKNTDSEVCINFRLFPRKDE